jgi:RarD protein
MSKAHIKISVAALLFSLVPIVTKLVPLNAISIVWTINFFGASFLILKLLFEGRLKELLRPGKSLFIILLLGIFLTINNVLYLSAVKLTTISNAIFTHYLAPLFLIFLARIFLKEKIERISVFAVIVSLLGLGILLAPNEFSFSNKHFIGLAIGTLSAVFYASEIATKKALAILFKPDIIVVWHELVLIFILLPFVSFRELSYLNVQEIIPLILAGLFAAGVGITLFISGLREAKAQHGGILAYLEPMGAILLGMFILREIPSFLTLLGGGLILISGYMVVRQES